MPFTVRMQGITGVVDRRANTNCRYGVLQHAPCTAVHVHIARRDERQLQAPALLLQFCELPTLPPVGEQFDGDPQAIAKRLAQQVILDTEGIVDIGYPQHETARKAALEILPGEAITAFFGGAARVRDQAAQCRVTVAVLRKRNEPAATLQPELRTDDELLQ